jgi:hypothetical protein
VVNRKQNGARIESSRRAFALLACCKRLWKLEVYRDLGLNFDGLIVEVIGFVLPLLDGVDCGT